MIGVVGSSPSFSACGSGLSSIEKPCSANRALLDGVDEEETASAASGAADRRGEVTVRNGAEAGLCGCDMMTICGAKMEGLSGSRGEEDMAALFSDPASSPLPIMASGFSPGNDVVGSLFRLP